MRIASGRDHGGLRLVLIVATLVYAAALVPLMLAALRVPTVLESAVTARVMASTVFMGGLPLVLAGATAAAWIAYARGRAWLAGTVLAVPLLWLAATLALVGA